MAIHGFYEPKHGNSEARIISGSFAPQGTSAPTTLKGRGFTVARNGVGDYTLTFQQKYSHLLSAVADVRFASPVGYMIQAGAYSAANKTLELEVFKLDTGYIPIDITSAREIASNDIQNLAAHGGLMASDSTPGLARVNAATDKALRLTWAAGDTTEVALPPILWPSDLDAGSDVTVHLLAVMESTNDTPTIDIQAWEGVGDTEMGGATAALSDTLAEVSTTLANANIAGDPGVLNLQLVPGAHATDALYVYGAKVEYTKKKLADISADADNRINFEAVFQASSAPAT